MLVAIAIVVLVVLAYFRAGDTAKSSFCFTLTGSEALALEGTGNPAQRARARIRMHGNNLFIAWEVLKQTGNISVANALRIHGPLTSADPVTTTNSTSLCGPPTSLACEGTDPTLFSGSRNVLDPGSISPETFIRAVRDNVQRYYVLLDTANGLLRAPLGTGCGGSDDW